MKEKIIYQSGDPYQGETFVFRVEKKRRGKFIPSSILIGAALGLLVLLFGPMALLELRYRLGLMKAASIPEVPKDGFAQVIQASDLVLLQPANPQFSLVIPKIGVNSAVLANVNPADEQEYRQALKQGLAHAAGTYFPGQNGSIYIFGHSSDYFWNQTDSASIFYLLKELEPGDRINLFYQGQNHVYQVAEKKIVSPDSLEYLRPTAGEEKLILQTCWPPATTWQSLLVLAEKV